MDELEPEGKWEIVEISRDIFPVPKGQPHPGLKVFLSIKYDLNKMIN